MRCLLVDSCSVYATGFVQVLSTAPGVGGVQAAASVERAVVVMGRDRPDVVLSALADLAEVARLVRTAAPVPVVVLHWSRRRDDARTVWAAGGAAYVPKDLAPERLLAVLADVQAGARCFPPLDDAAVRRSGPHVARRATDTAALTPRELEIVRLVLVGLPTKQVASRLGIAAQTTKNHLARAMAKAGVRSRVQLYAWAVAHGVMEESRAVPALLSVGERARS